MSNKIACLEGIAIEDVKSMHARPNEQFPDDGAECPCADQEKAFAGDRIRESPASLQLVRGPILRIDPRKSSGPLKCYSAIMLPISLVIPVKAFDQRTTIADVLHFKSLPMESLFALTNNARNWESEGDQPDWALSHHRHEGPNVSVEIKCELFLA